MTGTASVTRARRADRTAVLVALAGLTAVAWVLTVQLAGGMSMGAGSMDMARAVPAAMLSGGPSLLLVTGMWAAMMVGMMVPSATPMVVAYTDWIRRGPSSGNRAAAIGSFLSGYVLVWLGFSLLAAALQVTLDQIGALTAGATSSVVGGTVLVAAGVFQVTPWKESCLSRCRTPIGFVIAEWRDGARGALVMGIRHGAYCLGCCWALMGVLFVVGTMHLGWMAAIAGFVLVEKVAPRVLRVRYVAAVVLVGWGRPHSWPRARDRGRRVPVRGRPAARSADASGLRLERWLSR